jgi:hypothetical protein
LSFYYSIYEIKIVILGLDPRIQATLTPPLDSRFRENDKSHYVIASPHATLRVHPEGFSLKGKLREAIPNYGFGRIWDCHVVLQPKDSSQ